MGKKNKLRYQSKGNQYPTIALTGAVHVRNWDADAILAAVKGDLQLFPSTDALLGSLMRNYGTMGHEGYVKADVFDGKGWKPISLEEFFPGRDYYFGKRERPSDTLRLCVESLKKAAGTELMRTYREHYVKLPEGNAGGQQEEDES